MEMLIDVDKEENSSLAAVAAVLHIVSCCRPTAVLHIVSCCRPLGSAALP